MYRSSYPTLLKFRRLTEILLLALLTFPLSVTSVRGSSDPSSKPSPAKLLISEISTTGTDQEFIEIYNPGVDDVDLSDYYLTDAIYTPANQVYWRIAEGNPNQINVGGGAFLDFHARFPDGFTIADGDTIVITLPGSIAFIAQFGAKPTLEMFEDDLVADDVPDMRWIFGDEINNSIINRTGGGQPSQPTLANGGETVILYHWVAGEDKVTDIDVFAWKDPSYTSTSMFFNKTGVTIGGHTYLPEVGTNGNDAFGTENSFGNSYQRTDSTEGDQTPSGSNGVDGRDETSEDFNATFTMLPYDPPTPGLPVPEPDKLLIMEVSTIGTDEEYIEVFNPGPAAVDLSDYYLTDAIYNPSQWLYWRIGEGNPTPATVGGGTYYDFHARFPDRYFIAASDTIVISVSGSGNFFNSFGFEPDLELYEGEASSDQVPDMRWIFGDEANNSIINRTGTGPGEPSNPTLTNAAETVVLYHWVTGEDKVTDIDVFTWKDPASSTTSIFFNKTGVTIGGHSYLPETGTNVSDAFGTQNGYGNSYQRTDPTEGGQTPTGSNGVDGRDETSENCNTTFAMLPYDPSRPPDPLPDPFKLLLTEISTTGTDQEYIELYNPGAEAVDLSDFYLTDAIYSTGDQVYWRIAEGNPTTASVGGGAFFDFHARFPDGYSLAAGDTIVISLRDSDEYFYHFGFHPHLEMYEDGAVPDTIPDMRWVFGDEIDNSIINRTGSVPGSPSIPGLTNSGETVILYHWVPGEDKVTDIDVFAWKDPLYSSTSFFFNKTGVTIGSHTYLPEIGTNESDAFLLQNSFGNSYQRIDPTEGDQIPAGSNGVGGRDETSENFNTTFAMLPYDPASRPEVIIPVEGDWQNVGMGPMVSFPSSAHTWGDFDNNGIDDLFLIRPGVGTSSVLVHDVSMLSSGMVEIIEGDLDTESMDCVRGDFNRDGGLDLYVVKNTGTDWVYFNQGQDWDWGLWGWPVDFYGVTPVFITIDASMVDSDLDGWLEIFVTNAVGNNQLLDGRFGLTDLLPHSLIHESGTAGSAWCDLDGDRDPDLSSVSPTAGIAISLQEEPRRFSTSWLPVPTEGRDCAWADYDNDGDFDFALVCIGSNNIIYMNQGDGTFSQTPLDYPGTDYTTSCTWGDFDNDGFLDLHVTNRDGPNVLWRNDAGVQFAAVDDTVITFAGDDRGSSWLDIDEDGDLDLYISNHDLVNRLVRNNLNSSNNWVQIKVMGHHWGHQSNQAAIGAVIEVEAGGITQRRHVGGQEAGPGHSPLVHHFGLGSAAVVDRITVRWPFRFPNGSFHSTEIHDIAVNQRLDIEETVYGVSDVEPVPSYTNSLKTAKPNPFNPVTSIGFSLEKEAVVALDIYDVRGRLVRRLLRGEAKPAGFHQVEWRGKTEAGADAPSGVYIYRITAGEFTASQRMVLVR